jgi:hypothetical protein
MYIGTKFITTNRLSYFREYTAVCVTLGSIDVTSLGKRSAALCLALLKESENCGRLYI